MFNPEPAEASWHNFMCQCIRVVVSVEGTIILPSDWSEYDGHTLQ